MHDTYLRSVQLIQANIIPMVFGPPGLGKSTLAQNIADELSLELRDLRLSQYQGTDIGGFPYVKDGKGHFAHFGDVLFPLEHTPMPEGKDGWLVFLDELTLAEHDTLKVILRVLNERRLGEYGIHPKVRFMAAANPKGKGSLGRNLPDALIDRMAVMHVNYSYQQWFDWASKNGINKHLLDVMASNPLEDHEFGPREPDTPFISPRSLQQVSDYLDAGFSDKFTILAIAGHNFIVQATNLQAAMSMPDILQSHQDDLNRATPLTVRAVLESILRAHGPDALIDNISWLSENTPASAELITAILTENGVNQEPEIQDTDDGVRSL